MSTDARDPGAASPLPFGAGLRPKGPLGSDPEARGGKGAAPPRRPQPGGARSSAPAASDGLANRPELGTFLDADHGAPLGDAAARTLCAPVAGAFAGGELRGALERAMGPAATDARFTPTPEEVLAAFRGLQPWATGGGPLGADAVAVVVEPSEPFAHLGARLLHGLLSAPRVALIGHPELPGLGPQLEMALRASGVEPWRLAAFDRAEGAALRDLAGRPAVAMDLIDFDPVEGLTLDRLRRVRALAGKADSRPEDPSSPASAADLDRAPEGAASGDAGPEAEPEAGAEAGAWFGLGAVDRPPMPILARGRLVRQLYLGVETDLADAVLPEDDLAEAAELVVEQAFGQGALGGFASDAATSVLVRPDLLSAFTACLLETLEEVDEDPWFAPPPWVQRDGRSQVLRDLAAGRRRVLDEGATLIHERRLATGVACGLVFTNVEPRMKLAGEMSVPGSLFLVRALGAASAR